MSANQYVPFSLDAVLKGLNSSLFDPLIQLGLPLYLALAHMNIKLSNITSPIDIYNSIIEVNWLEVIKSDKYLLSSLGLLGISLIIRSNNWLSRRARNNGLSAKWDWNEEIVCVTGGKL